MNMYLSFGKMRMICTWIKRHLTKETIPSMTVLKARMDEHRGIARYKKSLVANNMYGIGLLTKN